MSGTGEAASLSNLCIQGNPARNGGVSSNRNCQDTHQTHPVFRRNDLQSLLSCHGLQHRVEAILPRLRLGRPVGRLLRIRADWAVEIL